MTERQVYEDKLVCAPHALNADERRRLLLFLRCYACCKSLLNALRGKLGRVRCEGWIDTAAALGRARRAGRVQSPVIAEVSGRKVSRGAASFRPRQ